MKASLRLKAGLTLWVFWVLVIASVAHLAHRGEQDSIEKVADQMFASFARDLAGAYAETLFHHKEEIDFHLRNLVEQNPDVVIVTLLDEHKRRIGSRTGKATGTEYSEITVPMKHRDRVVGTLHLGLSTESLRKQAGERQTNSYKLVILAAVAGLGLLLVVDARLRKILDRLIKSTQRMASGDLSQRIEIHTGDELEELGTAFNRMAQNLDESEDKLQKTNEMLSASVAERTRELSKSEIRYKNLVDSSGDAIITTDMRGYITFYNKSAEQIFGYTEPEMLGQPIYNLYTDGKRVAIDIMNRLAHSGTLRNREVKVEGRHGPRTISLSCSILHDEWGDPMGTLGVAKDITDLKALEKRLIHSERLATIGKMSAKIAHEIRNPLGSLSLNAEMLEEEVRAAGDDRVEVRQLVGAIAREIDRLTTVTEDYLEFSRVPKPSPSQVDLGDQLQTILSFMEKEFSEAAVRTELHLPEDPVEVFIDRRQMRQSIINLIRNALEAIEGDGQLAITLEAEPENVWITIEDSGPGISKADQDRIFEPFYTTKSGGTGLGLAICKEIITGQGGEISIGDSTRLGGAAIRLRIPRSAEETRPEGS